MQNSEQSDREGVASASAGTMTTTLSEALLVLTSWKMPSDDPSSKPTRTLVKDFCKSTLKSDEVSYKLYSTVFEVSEDQKKDAESVGVTLITATRSKWAEPDEDPAQVNWLFNHNMYYPQLKTLQGVKHVISFSSKTKNAAAAIHASLFPKAQLHQLSVPAPPGVLFAFDAWSRDACGLTGYHRAITQDFLARKAKSEEHLKAYSTVLDVTLSANQEKDAENYGVTLIKAQRKKGVDELPNMQWLVHHESYFPDLRHLDNIKYVVGYAPKTGWAAIEIQKLFPGAKLVLINHACQEPICLLVKDEFSELKEDMLQMASHADLLFSIGPRLYAHFNRAYNATINGRKLSDIPHKEILPKPRQAYFNIKKQVPDPERDIDGHCILTYGQLNTAEALKRCQAIAASIGSAANTLEENDKKPTDWHIHGVSEGAYGEKKDFLLKQLQSSHTQIHAKKQHSADTLLQSLQQSDICLPPSCYTDYSFEGLEAMAAGLPTTVQENSHIADMIDRYFRINKVNCVVPKTEKEMCRRIINKFSKIKVAIEQAQQLQRDLGKSEAVTESLIRFASLFTEKRTETHNADKNGEIEIKERQEKETAQTKVNGNTETVGTTEVNQGTTITELRETTESRQLLSHKSFDEDKISLIEDKKSAVARDMEITKTTVDVQPEVAMSVSEGLEIIQTRAVKPSMPVIEGIETTATTSVPPRMSVKDSETIETTAISAGMSVTDREIYMETTEVNPGISFKGQEAIETTANVQPEMAMSVTEGLEISQTTAVQPRMPVTEGIETTATTALNPGMLVKGEETKKLTCLACLPLNAFFRRRKTTRKKTEFSARKLRNENKREKRKPSQCGKIGRADSDEAGQIQDKIRTETQCTNPDTPPPSSPSDTAKGDSNGTGNFELFVKLDKEICETEMEGLVEKDQTKRIRHKKKKLKAVFKRCREECDKNSSKVVANEESQQTVTYNCKKYFGQQVKVENTKTSSLAIHLDLPTLYNLYRLEHTCQSGSFPDSFEPLLITEKMREEANKVGLQLKLKATYDQARFDALELFFMKRDGGGLEPVEVYHDFIIAKDAEEIHIDAEDIDQKPKTMVSEKVDCGSQTEQGQSLEVSQSKVEMAILKSQLKKAKEEKATVEERFKELTQTLEHTKQSVVEHHVQKIMKHQKLHPKLEKENKSIKEVSHKHGEQDTSHTWDYGRRQQSHDEFVELLHRIAGDLGKDELESMKFLCRNTKSMGIKKREVENINEARDLFQKLLDRKLITEDNSALLVKLLRNAKRQDLVELVIPIQPEDITENIQWLQKYLQEKYKRHYKDFKPIPWNTDVSLSLTEIYTRLKVIKTNRRWWFKQGHIIENELEIFRQRDKGLLCRRIAIEGAPAMGKSTFCRKLAYDWACGKLPQFQLLFFLEMRHVSNNKKLSDIVFHQLLPEDSNITKEVLYNYIERNQSSILCLFDGIDEMTSLSREKSDIPAIISEKLLTWCTVVTTTRPLMMHSSLGNCHAHFRIEGFTTRDAINFIGKYFALMGNQREAEKLMSELKLEYVKPPPQSSYPYTVYDDDYDELSRDEYNFTRSHRGGDYDQSESADDTAGSHIRYDLLCNPLHLSFVCLLWEESKIIPTSNMTDIYTNILDCVLKRYCSKNDKTLVDDKVPQDVNDEVNRLAYYAYDVCLKGNMMIDEGGLSETVLNLGLLVKDSGISRVKVQRQCFFYHKTWLEYFTALHICNNAHNFVYLIEREVLNEKQVCLFAAGILKKKADPFLKQLVKRMQCKYNTLYYDITAEFRFICECLREASIDIDYLAPEMPNQLILGEYEDEQYMYSTLQPNDKNITIGSLTCDTVFVLEQLSNMLCQTKGSATNIKHLHIMYGSDDRMLQLTWQIATLSLTTLGIQNLSIECMQLLAEALRKGWQLNSLILSPAAIDPQLKEKASQTVIDLFKSVNLNKYLENFSWNASPRIMYPDKGVIQVLTPCPLNELAEDGPNHVNVGFMNSLTSEINAIDIESLIDALCKFTTICKSTKKLTVSFYHYAFDIYDTVLTKLLQALKSASPLLTSCGILWWKLFTTADRTQNLVEALNMNGNIRDFEAGIDRDSVSNVVHFIREVKHVKSLTLHTCYPDVFQSLITEIELKEVLKHLTLEVLFIKDYSNQQYLNHIISNDLIAPLIILLSKAKTTSLHSLTVTIISDGKEIVDKVMSMISSQVKSKSIVMDQFVTLPMQTMHFLSHLELPAILHALTITIDF